MKNKAASSTKAGSFSGQLKSAGGWRNVTSLMRCVAGPKNTRAVERSPYIADIITPETASAVTTGDNSQSATKIVSSF